MKYTYHYDSPVGILRISADEEGITSIQLNAERHKDTGESPILAEAVRQLDEYFNGIRKTFDLPLSLSGTEFQRRVWQVLCEIPYGETCTYGQIAAVTGNPKASRAVGSANNRNPIAIVIPCHRVVGANGSLTGYAGGLDIKEYLLELEKRNA